jgi:hypothetical protein
LCIQIYVLLFPLHSWTWGSFFLNSILPLQSTYWKAYCNFLMFFSVVYISSLVLLTLVDGFYELSF